jgi:uncharacterized protein YbaR (Trm112 family)
MNPLELKARYEKGENITSLLRNEKGSAVNTDDIIELAYDLQSGSYVRGMKENADVSRKRTLYTGEVVDVIKSYCPKPRSFFKGGAGECVTLVPMLQQIQHPIDHVRGIDLCWSRLGYGRKWLAENGLAHVELAMGTLSEIPFTDNSFEVVVTSHSMEPNGGRERDILSELYRISGSYLFIAEPCYELASEEGKARMDKLGYVKGLEQAARELGFDVVENRPLQHSMSPLNPTSVLVIRKEASVAPKPVYACPKSKRELTRFDSCFYSNEQLAAYPVIEGIPCLRSSAAIVASKLPELRGE